MDKKLESLPLEDQPFSLDKHGPIFIMGCPRSGTTFLSNIFGLVADYEEFIGVLAPPRMMHLIRSMPDGIEKTSLLHCVRDVFWQSFWRRRFSRFVKLKKVWKGSLPLMKLFSNDKYFDEAIFCFKEPFLCFAAKDFAKYFPNSIFIHIIRDGRDNADSLDRSYTDALSDEILKSDVLSSNKVSEIGFWEKINGFNVPHWVPKNERFIFSSMSKFERCVLMWREMVLKGRELKNVLPNDRYYEIKYETLVENPIVEGQKLFDFLGKDMNGAIKKKLKSAYSSSVGISKERMNSNKIEKANALAGALLSELGYL